MEKTGVVVEVKNGQAKVRVPVEGGCGGCRGCSGSCRCAYIQARCEGDYIPGQQVILQTKTVPSLFCALLWLGLPLMAAVLSADLLPPWGTGLLWMSGMLGIGWLISVPLRKHLQTRITGVYGEDETDE